VEVDLRVRSAPVPKPKTTPKLVVLSGLLELASADLERAIQTELAENPALEVTEARSCEICGAVLSSGSCPVCRGSAVRRAERIFDEEDRFGRAATWGEEEWDPFSTVAAPWSFRDHLLWQLSPQLSGVELEIASLLLENLDPHGLLDCELDSVAAAAGVPADRVEAVLSIIQRQDPPGIAARTVEESLLIQLESLDADRKMVRLCRRLIEEHWTELCRGKVEKIAASLKVKADDVGRARDFIGSSLSPYPIRSCVQSPTSAERPVEEAYLRPDVIIAENGPQGEEEFEVLFPEESRYRLSLDPGYQAVSETLEEKLAGEDVEGYEHVRQCLERGRLFISSWQERWRTLRRVVEELVEYQEEFLRHDERSLLPLTRAQLAEKLGVHESTVSRAVASKYALLPGGRLVALADFFDGSLRAKSLIKEAVSQEEQPLTDGELVDLLAQAGVSVARRTVQKYRQALGILPSELR
jgi:RNA polymerase sigma-54 factor